MLSSKNKTKAKVKAYVKEQDSLYCGLLKLACVSDQTDYTPDVLKQAVITLNSLPDYVSVHQRIIPLLNAKARIKVADATDCKKETKVLDKAFNV
jgi:hypothetical protein